MHNTPPAPHYHKYHMIKAISKMRATSHSDRLDAATATMEDTCYILVANFLRAHQTWSIDSIVHECMRSYKDQGCTYKIISECIYDYVMDKN